MPEQSDAVTVAAFAKTHDVAPSTVLAECERLGFKASWAGAELEPEVVDALTRALGGDDPAEPTPVVVATPAAAVAAPPLARPAPDRDGPPAPTDLPPTAVGSLPDLADELVADAPPVDPPAGGYGHQFAGRRPERTDPTDPSDTEIRRPRSNPVARRLEPSVIRAWIAVGIALVALVLGEVTGRMLVALAGWIVAAIAASFGILLGNRARYRITTHPEKHHGLAAAVAALALSILVVVGLAVGVWVVTGAKPAADAPVGIGTSDAVQELRWGYRRATLIKRNGWSRPVRDAGTCWKVDRTPDDTPVERVQLALERVRCDVPHEFEVLGVYSVDRDADADFPAVDDLVDEAKRRCAADHDPSLIAGLPLVIERPTATGWADGDHDLACLAHATRDGSLLDR